MGYDYPDGGTIMFGNPVAPAGENEVKGTHFSILGIGGIHEATNIQQRNDIPTDSNGKQVEKNIFSSGRRQVGMLVHVYGDTQIEPTIYKLIPQGFWGNNGAKNTAEWLALSEEQRVTLLNPALAVSAAHPTTSKRYNVIFRGEIAPNGEELKRSQAKKLANQLMASVTEAEKELCWVKLELGGDTTPYVNGVQNKPGAWSSVDQTGETGDAPAVYGNKKFINSELHLRYSPSDTVGGPGQISDTEDDAALKVDKKVTIGTASEEIFSVKDNEINLHTIANIKNIPIVTTADISRWGHSVPVASDTITIGSYTHTFKIGDLYLYSDSSTAVSTENHTAIGVIAS
jgi:hypothetical protein